MDPSYNNSYGSQMPVAPVLPETGDIVLAPEGGKKTKKGWLLVGVVGVVVVVLVMLVVAVSFGVSGTSSANDADIKVAFSELYDYVVSNRDELNENPDRNIALASVFLGLEEKYTNFEQALNAESAKKIKEKLDDNMAELAKYMQMAEFAMDPGNVTYRFAREYELNGAEAVAQKIAQIKEGIGEDSMMIGVAKTETVYYALWMKLYEEFYKVGCTRDSEIDFECANAYFGDVFDLNVKDVEVQKWRNKLQGKNTVIIVYNSLYGLLEEIKDKIGG